MVRGQSAGSTRRRARSRRPGRAPRGASRDALAGVLAFGTGALGGLFAGIAPASAAAPTPGWTATATSTPTGPDTPGANPRRHLVLCLLCRRPSSASGPGRTRGPPRSFRSSAWSVTGRGRPRRHRFRPTPDQTRGRAWPPSLAPRSVCAWPSAPTASTSGGFTQHGLVETLSDGSWTPLDAPVPPDGATALDRRARRCRRSTARRRRPAWPSASTTPTGGGGIGQFGLIDTERGAGAHRRPRSPRMPHRINRRCCRTCRARRSACAPPPAVSRRDYQILRRHSGRSPCSSSPRRGRGRPRTRRFLRTRDRQRGNSEALDRLVCHGLCGCRTGRVSRHRRRSSGCSNSSRPAHGSRSAAPQPSNAGTEGDAAVSTVSRAPSTASALPPGATTTRTVAGPCR